MRITQTGTTLYDKALATPGVTLFSPLYGTVANLIDLEGNILHQWPLPSRPAGYARLLENGNLFYACLVEDGPPTLAGAKGGLMREVDWDGNVLREHKDDAQHHDARRLDNGHLLYACWEKLSDDLAGAVQGGLPDSGFDDGSLWGDAIREVDHDGNDVWNWQFWEHVDPADYPLHPMSTRRFVPWCNTVFPLPNGDVLASFRLLNLIVLVDRQTNEIRWQKQDPTWGMQHDCQFLENGNILLFANGVHSPHPHSHSRVIELNPETGEEVWVYQAETPNHFYSHHISGSERLWSGNTLICEGSFGRLFEVTPDRQIVWEYINPDFGKDLMGNPVNWVFRAFRYAIDGPEIAGRL